MVKLITKELDKVNNSTRKLMNIFGAKKLTIETTFQFWVIIMQLYNQGGVEQMTGKEVLTQIFFQRTSSGSVQIF